MGDSSSPSHRFVFEIAIRFFLLLIYLICELIPPFLRVIQPEELWMYRYPTSTSYIPMQILWILALTVPLTAIVWAYSLSRNKLDLTEALWCFSLIICINGALTNSIKVMVGRPRPDYAQRCFPDNDYMIGEQCTGNYYTVIDGRKSFPSGHSSVAFASFGFLTLYLAGKLKVFTISGKGSSMKIIVILLPLFFSICVAISRTCDYHHHWQDVTVGSLLGILVTSLCYFQFYPKLSSDKCDIPWKQITETKDDPLLALRVKEV